MSQLGVTPVTVFPVTLSYRCNHGWRSKLQVGGRKGKPRMAPANGHGEHPAEENKPRLEIWKNSEVLRQLRDPGNLKGKCGCCELRNICMGCRAQSFAATGDYLDEEPFCVYQPRIREKREFQNREVPAHAQS